MLQPIAQLLFMSGNNCLNVYNKGPNGGMRKNPLLLIILFED